MEQEEVLILEDLAKEPIRRRLLLPLWIKFFTWIFMLTGAATPLIILIAISGGAAQVSLYGLQSADPTSVSWVIIVSLFLFKGIAAFGLWMEKDWAVTVAITDAILGIGVCFLMFVFPVINPDFNFTIRLEPALLIPYLIKLFRIQQVWVRK